MPGLYRLDRGGTYEADKQDQEWCFGTGHPVKRGDAGDDLIQMKGIRGR